MTFPIQLMQDKGCVRIVQPGRLHPAVSFARASTATQRTPTGLASVATNVPRYEYDASGNFLGLLIEQQRTNLQLRSQDFTTRTKNNTTVTGNASVAPDGTTTMSRVVTAAGVALGAPVRVYAGTPTTAGDVITRSLYLKAGSGIPYAEILDDSTGPTAGAIYYGVPAATVTLAGMGVAVSLSPTPVGGSYRTGYAYTAATTRGADNHFITLTNRLSGNPSPAFVGGEYVDVWGEQVEKGNGVTSYIPTTTAAVTRSADVAQATSLSALGVSTTSGTFFIEHDALAGAPLIYSGSNKILDAQGGTKVAIAYDATETRVSVDGSPALVGPALTWSTTLDLLRSATAGANAHVKTCTYWPTKRADSELRRMSYALLLVLIGTYPNGTAGLAYSAALPIGGGVGGYSNPRVTAGSLPAGVTSLAIVSDVLVLSGTPTTGASATFTVAVDSADGQTAYSTQTMTIAGATTWNPSDKAAAITLSSGNLVATKGSGSTYASVRGTNGKSSGKRMFRIINLSSGIPPSELLFGIASAAASLTNYVGSSAAGWAKDGTDGGIYHLNASVQSGPNVSTGSTAEVYVDLTSHTVCFGLNSAAPSAGLTIASGIWFPAATVTTTTVPDQAQLDVLNNTSWGTSNGYTLWDY